MTLIVVTASWLICYSEVRYSIEMSVWGTLNGQGRALCGESRCTSCSVSHLAGP